MIIHHGTELLKNFHVLKMQADSQTKKIRIGYLMHGIGYGGAVNSLLLLLNNLDKNHFELYIYTIKSSVKELEFEFRRIADDFSIISLPTISFNQVYQNNLRSFRKARNKDLKYFTDRLLNDKIDILHINSTLFSNVIEFVKSNLKIPIVCHLRELIPDLGKDNEIRDYIINQIHRVDQIVAISENEARYFSSHKNILILPNPIDFKIIEQTKYKNEEPIKSENGIVFVGMTGSFYASKGHLNFLKSLDYLINTKGFTDVKFFILGSKLIPFYKRFIKWMLGYKDFGKELVNYIAKRKLEKYVVFLPYTKNILKYLYQMDIIVRPADTADPWGRDIIESMALGKPVIATGYSEFYIKNAENGYLVPPLNPSKLGESIFELASNSSSRKELGLKAYEKVKMMCDVTEYSKHMISIYNSLYMVRK